MNIKVSLLGGDTRTVAAAARLAECGFVPWIYGIDISKNDMDGACPSSGTVDSACCSYVGGDTSYINRAMGEFSDKIVFTSSYEEAVKGSKCVILPLPVTADGATLLSPLNCGKSLSLKRVCEIIKESGVKLVCGGKIPSEITESLQKDGICVFDYYGREEFAVANAVPTAEGAVEIAMRELPVTIHGAHVLVIGYGRIGKVLARLLDELGAIVTVSARKESDFAWIRAGGLSHATTGELSTLFKKEKFDVIFNTVPVMVIGEKELENISENTLIVDLASKPGGINSVAAKSLGRRAIWALSLPGKVAPVTAGRIIADTVLGHNLMKGDF